MGTIRGHISSLYPGHSWELVSERSVRSIYRLVRQGKVEYYAKIYSPRMLPDKLRNFLYPRTLYEARMLARLLHSGLPVPEVCNHIRMGSESALITHAVFPARGLFEVERERQIRVMLDMSVQLLNRGYRFTDMHIGNIILDRYNSPVLVDAYEIYPVKKMTSGHAASLFAQVASAFDLPVERIEPYLVQVEGIGDVTTVREMIRFRSRFLRREQVRRRVRRSLREGSFSRVLVDPLFRAFVNRTYSPDFRALIDEHFTHVSEGIHLYKIQRKTQLSRVGEYCVKSYKKAWPPAAPYAVRSWKGSLRLLFNNIPVADPVAVIVFRDRKSMLVTRALNQPDLDRFLGGDFRCLPLARKRDLASSLGIFVGNLHAKGIYHADLKACNIKAGMMDPVQFFLLDTDRVEQRKSLPRKKRLKNLVQINTSIPLQVSRTMRMAFLRAYCSLTGDDPKDLFRKVWQLSAGSEVIYCSNTGDITEQWPGR
jgi:tRNA A-37 threonylcarbamoyl transferase component Bud32